MAEYPLYLESGPKHRTTMVHVIDLMGCVVTGPTTDDAVEAAPTAIRRYLAFLRRHGEDVDPDAPFGTPIAEHVVERGGYLAGGNPTPGFSADFQPLSRERLDTMVRHYGWLHTDVVDLARRVANAIDELLSGSTWTYRQLLEHIAAAEYEYLRCSLGHIDGLRKEVRSLQQDAGDPVAALERLHDGISARLSSVSDEELAITTVRGARTWTVARTVRRILEHRWEHHRQLAAALGE